MITRIFNGKIYYNQLLLKLKNKNETISKYYKNTPILAIFLFGNNFANNLYVKKKITACNHIYLIFFLFKTSSTIKSKTILILISILNLHKNINGIFIQMPIPKSLDKINILNSINYLKDIDVISPLNFGFYMYGLKKLASPSTPRSILYSLKTLNIKTYGLKAAIFGFSNIIGKPLCYELITQGISVSVINRFDKNFLHLVKSSDIIVSAVGIPNFLSYKQIPFGSIVIDVGISKIRKNITSGDINTKNILKKASWLIPTPGGIGPLTVLNLLDNVLKTYTYQKKN